MCQLCPAAAIGSRLARRNGLRPCRLPCGARAFAKDNKGYRSRRTCRHPDAALDQLMKGNARYVEGVSRRHDFKHEREPLAQGQNPFAAVLSCADSRIAPEFCFDTARGDVFVCRHAGNFADEETIASFEYGVAVLNVPLLMVLGHDACGAIDSTIKSIKDNTTLPGHLPALVHALTPAVQAAQGKPGDLPRQRHPRQRGDERRPAQDHGADPESRLRRQQAPRRRRRLQSENRTRRLAVGPRAAALRLSAHHCLLRGV